MVLNMNPNGYCTDYMHRGIQAQGIISAEAQSGDHLSSSFGFLLEYISIRSVQVLSF